MEYTHTFFYRNHAFYILSSTYKPCPALSCRAGQGEKKWLYSIYDRAGQDRAGHRAGQGWKKWSMTVSGANDIMKKIPRQDVKSYFVWNENNITPKQTNAVIPTAINIDSNS